MAARETEWFALILTGTAYGSPVSGSTIVGQASSGCASESVCQIFNDDPNPHQDSIWQPGERHCNSSADHMCVRESERVITWLKSL